MTMTNKRERELARAKRERQLERRKQQQTRDRFLKVFVSTGLVVIVAVAFSVAKNSGNSAAPATSPSVSAAPTSSGSTTVPICLEVGPHRTNDLHFAKVPDSAKPAYGLNLLTNCGRIAIALDKRAPKTITAMSFLAKQSFFNQTECHRLTTQGLYVLQCGDPTATGSGGPGFSFKDENLPKATAGTAVYKRGTVAMANSGPNTNGSQFFLVYKDSPLPPNYSVWGTMTSGLNILDKVADAGVAGGGTDGNPNQRVVISKAIVTP